MKSAVQTVKQLKCDSSLFGQLFIAAQTSKGDLDKIFEHESQASPPFPSIDGKLYRGQKSDLLHEIMDKCDMAQSSRESDTYDGKVRVTNDMPGSFDAVIMGWQSNMN